MSDYFQSDTPLAGHEENLLMSSQRYIENEGLYRRTKLMKEAEHHRLVQLALSGRERPVRPHSRAAWRLGDLLVILGRRLQAQDSAGADCTGEVSSSVRTSRTVSNSPAR